MPPLHEPRAANGSSRFRTHRILAAIALVAAVTQGVSWWLGQGNAGLAAIALVLMGAGFVAADLLDARGQERSAILVTSFTILIAVPVMAWLFEPGSAAALMAPIAFILALPHLRGRRLAVLGIVGVVLSALAATMQQLKAVATRPSDAALGDGIAFFVGVSAVTAVLFVLAWRVDRAREEASARVQGLLRELPIGVARTDPNGYLLEVNDAYARMFGYPDAASAVGLRTSALVVDMSEMMRIIGELEGGREVVRQIECRRRDGTTFWVRFTSRAIHDEHGTILWYDTATEDVTAERRIHDDQVRLAAIVDAADLTIVSVALDGRITAWNGGAERLFGWTDRDASYTVYDVSPPAEWEWIRSNHARAAEGETLGPFEVERLYDGRQVFLAVTVFPIRDADGVVTTIANVGRDITADVRLRAERSRLEEQLRESQRLEATGRLAGGIAHDFNNLLTAIRGHGSVLLDELPSGTPAREAAEQILCSSVQASELTHQLLAFARRLVLQPEVVDIDAVIGEQVATLRRLVGGSIDLIVDAGSVAPLVMADRGQLVEVLLHLVLNAREAMPDGGTVRLVTRVAPATESLDPGTEDRAVADGGREVVLRVEDTGAGIAPDTLPHVFEPFFTTKEMGRGTGLGLAMVHGVVRQSGGRIEVATGPAGTAMIIRLPLASMIPIPVPRTASPERPVEGARILLVDDDPVVRAIARRILVTAGFDVLEAADAAQARTLFDAGASSIDLLVTDVIMPGMRGPDLARLIRERQPDLPVLFISGYAGEDALDDLQTGSAGFIAKPFEVEGLLAKVRGLLGGGVAAVRRDGPPEDTEGSSDRRPQAAGGAEAG